MNGLHDRRALPEGWEWKRLIDVLSSLENGARPKGGVDNIEEGVPSVGGEHLNKDGGFIFETMKFIPTEFYENMKRGRIENGDVLVVKDGATTGKVSLVRDDFPYQQSAVNEHVFICRPNQKYIQPKYLFYNLFSPLGQNKILRSFHGAAQGGINTQFANDYEIPLPPLPTQRHIVTILEKAEETKRLRAQADKLTDRLLQSVFLEMFGDPVRNPKGWEIVKFSEAGSLQRGKSKHRPRNAPELLSGPYPLIQTGDVANSKGYIREYTQTYSELGLKQSKMWHVGTLCITIAANIAKTGILTFSACFPDSIVGFRPNENVKTEFVQFLLSFLQRTLEETAPESAQKNINLEILSDLNMPLPPLPLQQKFACIVEKVESVRRNQKQSLQEIDNLFSTLMQKAFLGELVM